MAQQQPDKQQIKMMEALATVSSLAVMTVMDFLLAYFGGDWLDNYFQTGDHSFRIGCICLALLTVFLTFYKLVASVMHDHKQDKDGHRA